MAESRTRDQLVQRSLKASKCRRTLIDGPPLPAEASISDKSDAAHPELQGVRL